MEGNPIYTGSLVCPSPDLCDRKKWERHEGYVERHLADHKIDLAYSENAERNLGLWCFYYDHKYVWGNPTLAPQPHWEMHAFISESNWSATATEQNRPAGKRTYSLPPLADRGETEYRRFKQVEVPRQCEKTSIGARAYPVFRSKHEYFVNDKANYRIIVRSNTKKNVSDTLAVIRRMSSRSQKIVQLYGTWTGKCDACFRLSHNHERFSFCLHEDCGKKLKRVARRVGLVNEAKGAGAYGADMMLFRWLTDAADADAFAAYNLWVAGLGTSTTGQRPDLYIWDDPQTEENSDNVDKRAKIAERFDESVRQLEIPGELLVLDTRKYVDDFAGGIQKPPLNGLFYTLHRPVRWPVSEPDAPPYVVDGFRYYYPIKGNGEPALNKSEVDRLEKQMAERRFSAEYMNNPLDPTKSLFKRDQFKIIAREDAPIEVKYGLGRDVTPSEQQELAAFGLRVIAYNSCDPASKSEQSRRGDDTFIVGLRPDRYGALYVTCLRAGKWTASRTWDEIAKANAYNRPIFTDYEMPADEKHVQPSFEKWTRERSEALSGMGERPVSVMVPMRWSHMPKSGKDSRIEQMENWTKNGRFFILADAGDEDLVEKYISQWIGYGVSDHDDGPDATSRLLRWLVTNTYQQPEKEPEESVVKVEDGRASVPLSLIKEMSIIPAGGTMWGERGW